jgi:hypothetical protein
MPSLPSAAAPGASRGAHAAAPARVQIESRPMRSAPLAEAGDPGGGRRFRYLFYLDVVGNLADPAMQNALRHLKARSGGVGRGAGLPLSALTLMCCNT